MIHLDIPHRRLFNQRLNTASFSQPVEVVDWLAAVQAQEYLAAIWSLASRMQSAVDVDIEQAFNEGSLLRTHVLRPTWHFVSPADIRWLLALSAPRVHTVNGTIYRQQELDNATLNRGGDLLARALAGHKTLTRDELRDELENAGLQVGSGLRLAYIVMYAELEGLICSGPRRGKQFTYALLEERAPQARSLGREQALAELARRYFFSRGPATVQDFAKWSGLTVAEATSGLEAVRSQLYQVIVDGQIYWFPETAPTPEAANPQAYLLSIYDEYISGYKDRRDICTDEFADRLQALGNALHYIIVLNGQIVGTWKRTLKKDAVIIETNPFTRMTVLETQAIERAAQRYGEFLGLSVLFQ